MAAQPRPDDLARLRDEFDAFRAQVARDRRRRPPRRLVPLALAALLVALLPLSLLAAGPFGDLDPAQDGPTGHNPNIQAIADAGITRGCNPPDNTLYCPKDLVTREQMASFLARTAGLGGNPPVANALTARDAATVGGRAPASLGRVNQGTAAAPVALGTQDQPVASATLTVPAPGYLLVVASFELRTPDGKPGIGGGVASIQCDLLVATGAGRLSPPVAAALEDSAGLGAGAVVHVFDLDAGKVGERRFDLLLRLAPGSPPVVATGTVAALYVPFGPTGTTP